MINTLLRQFILKTYWDLLNYEAFRTQLTYLGYVVPRRIPFNNAFKDNTLIRKYMYMDTKYLLQDPNFKVIMYTAGITFLTTSTTTTTTTTI